MASIVLLVVGFTISNMINLLGEQLMLENPAVEPWRIVVWLVTLIAMMVLYFRYRYHHPVFGLIETVHHSNNTFSTTSRSSSDNGGEEEA